MSIDRMLRTVAVAVASGLVGFVITPVAQAQSVAPVDPRLQPWIGCWRASELTADAGQPTRACVVPSTTVQGSVDLRVYAGDSLLSQQPIPRPGSVVDRTVDACRGTETATWTSDDTRLILRAELACGRGLTRVETGMMSLLPTGEWLQLQHLAVGTNAATTATRFYFDDEVGVAGSSLGELRSTRALRMAVGAPVAPAQLLELTRLTPVELVEAWITETAPRYALDGQALASLADRGLPPRVIDLLVASAHPERFTIRPDDAARRDGRTDGRTDGRAAGDYAVINDQGVSRGRAARCAAYDEFCYGPAGMGAWGMGWRFGYGPWDPWDPWGDAWGYRYGTPFSRYGYGSVTYPYGYGGYGGLGTYWGQRPIVIVNRPTNRDGDSDGPSTRGRAVKGGGYTRAEPASGSSTPPRSGGGSSGSGGGRSSGGSSSGGTSTGGASTGRSAKPRPPGGS